MGDVSVFLVAFASRFLYPQILSLFHTEFNHYITRNTGENALDLTEVWGRSGGGWVDCTERGENPPSDAPDPKCLWPAFIHGFSAALPNMQGKHSRVPLRSHLPPSLLPLLSKKIKSSFTQNRSSTS